jgi:hypothetical protein
VPEFACRQRPTRQLRVFAWRLRVDARPLVSSVYTHTRIQAFFHFLREIQSFFASSISSYLCPYPPPLLGPVGRLRSRSHAIACNVFVRLRLRTICSASVRRLFSLSRPRDVPHPIARSRAGVRTFDIQLLMLEEIRSTAQHF